MRLAQQQPILYNAQLKRLYRSIEVFKRNIISHNMYNSAASTQFKNAFIETMEKLYIERADSGNKIPKQFGELIGKFVDEEIPELNLAWYKRKLVENVNQQFTKLFADNLKSFWSQGQLPKLIIDQLLDNKDRINSIDALINFFRNKTLPEKAYLEIKKKLINTIVTDINAKHISKNDAFGAFYTKYRNLAVQNDPFDILSSIIHDWQNNQVPHCISIKIEGYLQTAINELKGELGTELAQQFEDLAVNAFLSKLQNGQYSPEITTLMQSMSLKIAEALMLKEDKSLCREYIYSKAMQDLYSRWNDKHLPGELQDYVTRQAFSSVNSLEDRIENQVWSHKQSDLVAKLDSAVRAIAKLTDQVQHLSKGAHIVKEQIADTVSSSPTPTFFK